MRLAWMHAVFWAGTMAQTDLMTVDDTIADRLLTQLKLRFYDSTPKGMYFYFFDIFQLETTTDSFLHPIDNLAYTRSTCVVNIGTGMGDVFQTTHHLTYNLNRTFEYRGNIAGTTAGVPVLGKYAPTWLAGALNVSSSVKVDIVDWTATMSTAGEVGEWRFNALQNVQANVREQSELHYLDVRGQGARTLEVIDTAEAPIDSTWSHNVLTVFNEFCLDNEAYYALATMCDGSIAISAKHNGNALRVPILTWKGGNSRSMGMIQEITETGQWVGPGPEANLYVNYPGYPDVEPVSFNITYEVTTPEHTYHVLTIPGPRAMPYFERSLLKFTKPFTEIYKGFNSEYQKDGKLFVYKLITHLDTALRPFLNKRIFDCSAVAATSHLESITLASFLGMSNIGPQLIFGCQALDRKINYAAKVIVDFMRELRHSTARLLHPTGKKMFIAWWVGNKRRLMGTQPMRHGEIQY